MGFDFHSEGFFGYGEYGSFRYFTLPHFIPLILLAAAIVLTYKYREAIRNWKYEERFRYILSFVMIIVEMSYFWRLLYVGGEGSNTLMDRLPLQLCQWGLICCCYMILCKNKFMFNFNFYVSIIFGSAAMIFPTVIVHVSPLYWRYYQFWLEHALPVYATIYMMFVHGMRPSLKMLPKVMIPVFILGLICIYANNHIDGAVYMYLGQTSEDQMGSNPIVFMPDNQYVRLVMLASIGAGLSVLHYYGWKKFFDKHDNEEDKKLAEQQ